MASDRAGWLQRHYRLFLAMRYLRARRKQAFTSVVTVVSVLGVTVGVAALIIALALLTGFQNDIQGKIIGANAHVFVQPFGPYLEEPEQVMETALAVPGVVGAAPAILTPALIIGNSSQPTFVHLKGVDPESEARTTRLLDTLVEGSAEGLTRTAGGPPGIVLGYDLSVNLFARPGDMVRVIMYSPNTLSPLGMSTSWRVREFEVVGVFRAGMFEYDNTWALIPLTEAQRLLEIGGAVSLVQVAVQDVFATAPVVQEVADRLGEGYLVMDWQQMNRAYFAALQLEKLALFVTISLIVGVAALNIVATLVLTIKDKQRDIGILMSLGATGRDILGIFMVQGLVIGLIGTGLGATLGATASVLLDRYEVVRLEAQVYYLSYVPFEIQWGDVTRVCLLSVLITFAATLYPAWRASRLDPVVSLRYE